MVYYIIIAHKVGALPDLVKRWDAPATFDSEESARLEAGILHLRPESADTQFTVVRLEE